MSVSHLGVSLSQESAPQPDSSDAQDGPAGSWMPWRLAVVFELRRSEPFARLTRAEWAVFEAIATVWDRGAREWPTQWALARRAGYSERAVRPAIVELKRRGILGEDGYPPGAWAQRGRCVPGPVTVRELGAIRRRFAPASQRARKLPEMAYRFIDERPDGRLEPRFSGSLVDHLLRQPLPGNIWDLRRMLLTAIDASPGEILRLPKDE